jgi:hypothetical protein
LTGQSRSLGYLNRTEPHAGAFLHKLLDVTSLKSPLTFSWFVIFLELSSFSFQAPIVGAFSFSV